MTAYRFCGDPWKLDVTGQGHGVLLVGFVKLVQLVPMGNSFILFEAQDFSRL